MNVKDKESTYFQEIVHPLKSFYKGGWVVVYFKCLLTSASISFIWIFSKLVQIEVSLEQFHEKSWYSAKHVKKGICHTSP